MPRSEPVRDYHAVAMALARRYFSYLVKFHKAEVEEECARLAHLAATRGRIQVGVGKRRRLYGTGSKGEKMGLTSYSHAAYASRSRLARQHGDRRVRPPAP
jgi:hypothetical protein